jgi:hypothetical protein
MMRPTMRHLLTVAAFLNVSDHARAFDNGQYENVDPAVRSWFKSVRSPHGVPCCDISDGHRTATDQRTRTQEEITGGMSEWWVPIEGEWRQVPEAAVIYNAGNPVGEAVVWWVRNENAIYIRCFVPGSGV